MSEVRAAVLPPLLALLPERAGLVDPVPELRAACRTALADLLAAAGSVVVLHDPLDDADRARGLTTAGGARVAGALLADAGWTGATAYRAPEELGPREAGPAHPGAPVALLVMANGSARRGEKAPGHLDERSFAFDREVGAALAGGDAGRLAGLDADLGDALWAAGVRGLRRLGALLGAAGGPPAAEVRWAGDPYGVQYWVVTLASARAPGRAADRP